MQEGIQRDTTRRVKPKSAKVLWVRRKERQVKLCKWKERLSESSNGEWAHLLKRNLEVWLKRDHVQITSILRKWCAAMGRSTPIYSAWSWWKAPIAPTAIEESEMMMPNTPCLGVQHFNCNRKTRWPPYKRWVNSLLPQTVWSRLCWKAHTDETRWPFLSLWQCAARWR